MVSSRFPSLLRRESSEQRSGEVSSRLYFSLA
jgi:hypothetical protein